MMDYLQNRWTNFASQWISEEEALAIFEKLKSMYSEPHRHYHTMRHLHNMFKQWDTLQPQLIDPNAVEFAVWFHDAIYDAKRNDNEEKSAQLARQIMLGMMDENAETMTSVQQLILSSQKHRPLVDVYDCHFFIDLDLAILSADANDYMVYCQQIRQEYIHYPSFIYRMGRKQALVRFLNRSHIYCTNYFRQHYEPQAQENIRKEIGVL